ncbi:MAG: tetratricopeptide repeat protein, partial [Deltaproteobacteria bacterium]|nr:tetratricopeptide repeat protein [Deltaproteobacteria bacterium]
MNGRQIFLLGILLLGSGCASMWRSGPLQAAFDDEAGETKQLIRLGHYQQAIDQLNQILEMDPENEQARFLRGLAYQNMEDFPSAIRDYEAILKKNPKSAKANYNLGMIFAHKLEDLDRAIAYFDRFLSLDPDHTQARSVAATMRAMDEQRQSEKIAEAQLQVQLNELIATENSNERREKLIPLIRLYPELSILYYMAGKTYEGEGNI